MTSPVLAIERLLELPQLVRVPMMLYVNWGTVPGEVGETRGVS